MALKLIFMRKLINLFYTLGYVALFVGVLALSLEYYELFGICACIVVVSVIFILISKIGVRGYTEEPLKIRKEDPPQQQGHSNISISYREAIAAISDLSIDELKEIKLQVDRKLARDEMAEEILKRYKQS